MRVRFVLSEVGIGLRRNLTLTVAAIVTTAVSLTLLGGGLLVRQQVARINSYYYGKLEVAIYLDSDVTQAQRDAISSTLSHDPLVKATTYESQAQAYARFSQQNSDNPDLVKAIGPGALPESFRVQLKDPTQYDVAQARYQALPGVNNVYDYKKILQPFFTLFNGFKKLAYIVAAVQVAAAALLIYNTVRVSAFGRRRETGIMRLVGASSFSIQLPFLVEGAVAGLLGALAACGAMAGLKVFVVDDVIVRSIGRRVFPPLQWGDVTGAMPVLVVVGVGLSVLASFVTLRRFLRV